MRAQDTQLQTSLAAEAFSPETNAAVGMSENYAGNLRFAVANSKIL